MKTSEVIKLMKEGTHCIYKDTFTAEDKFKIIIDYFIPKDDLIIGNFSNDCYYWYDIEDNIIICGVVEPRLKVIRLSEIEPDNEKPYLFYEGEKYYFGDRYELSEDGEEWDNRELHGVDLRNPVIFNSYSKSFNHIRKIDHTAKYKKLFLELKEQAEKDGVNLKELI